MNEEKKEEDTGEFFFLYVFGHGGIAEHKIKREGFLDSSKEMEPKIFSEAGKTAWFVLSKRAMPSQVIRVLGTGNIVMTMGGLENDGAAGMKEFETVIKNGESVKDEEKTKERQEEHEVRELLTRLGVAALQPGPETPQ